MSGENDKEKGVPNERDIRIYVLHKIEGFALRRIAAEVEVTPARVHQIVREVEPWVLGQLVADHPDRMNQKLLATARLNHIYCEAMKGWRRSLKNKQRETSKTGGKFGDSSESMSEGQAGDSTMLARAIDAQKQINELWGLAEPKKHKHEGHLTSTVTHVGQSALTPEQRAINVLDDLRAEVARRGLVIDVASVARVGEADGQGRGPAGDGESGGLPPPADDRRPGDDSPA